MKNKMKRKYNIFSNPHWILSGSKENFKYALFSTPNIWGVYDKWFPQWKALSKGDVLFFYVSDNIKRIIGIGKVGNKFIQHKPLWPDELKRNEVLYPLRFEFVIEFILPEKEWKISGITITQFIYKELGKGASADLLRGGINFIRHKRLLTYLYQEFQKKFKYKLDIEEKEIPKLPEERNKLRHSLHSYLQTLLIKIGKMNNFISEKEYVYENLKFDCVWRRIEKGAPTYVFEIQVGGEIYRALSKLKHAYDLWNSNVFLIILNNKDKKRVFSLLHGTFHEIQGKLKIIMANEIETLYNKKNAWIEFERKLGIL